MAATIVKTVNEGKKNSAVETKGGGRVEGTGVGGENGTAERAMSMAAGVAAPLRSGRAGLSQTALDEPIEPPVKASGILQERKMASLLPDLKLHLRELFGYSTS